MRRRDFIRVISSTAGAVTLAGCSSRSADNHLPSRRLLLVAFDGLDPRLLQKLMSAGRLPNFTKLASRGSVCNLQTTTPPQTPVAFSTVLTGTDPGQHGVFDFIHRDPSPSNSSLPVRPFFSTAEAIPPTESWSLPLGNWQLPLAGGGMELLRKGPAFWQHLSAAGIPTDVYFVPSNFPCEAANGPGRVRAISGMGTPDLLGTHGEFTFFSSAMKGNTRRVSGGRFVPLLLKDHSAEAAIPGPLDWHARADQGELPPQLFARLQVQRDPRGEVVLLRSGETKTLLNVGEWSAWLPLEFVSHLPGARWTSKIGAGGVSTGMVRVFIRSVHPHLELYVSPVNLDPLRPAWAVSEPAGFAAELAAQHGRFYTQGIPEDTKAFTHGALSAEAFVSQAALAGKERAKLWRAALADFHAGCMFFYFGASDLMQHMFWRHQDPEHPGFDPAEAEKYQYLVPEQYEQADARLGEALAVLTDKDMLIAFSDHGFTSFRQGFNLNSWLAEEGFLRLANPAENGNSERHSSGMFAGVDWGYSQAYGLGMNGLYVNMAGREKFGHVRERESAGLLAEIKERLLAVKDSNGQAVMDRVELTRDLYPQADARLAPDLILGYADGFRASWDSVLGGLPRELIVPNLEQWSGEHLISARLVPGVLVASRQISVENPHLRDLAPTVLGYFGLDQPKIMLGRNLFSDLRPT